MNKFEVVSAYADKEINIPTRATHAAAGYDFEVAEDIVVPSAKKLWDEALYYITGPQYVVMNLADIAAFTKEYKVKPTLVPTGIKCQLENDCYLELSVRSSTPLKHWLILANGVGIIDGDYYNNPDNEGHIYFQLINLSPFDIVLKKGDKIGQGIIKRFEVTDDDSKYEKKERAGGFGSTSPTVDAAQMCMDDFLSEATDTGTVLSKLADDIDKTSFNALSQKVQEIQERLYKQLQGTMIHG
jgi:dUTP pyrophosphatase